MTIEQEFCCHPTGDCLYLGEFSALRQECEALRQMVTWAYSKMHSRTFSSMEDALELDRLKLYTEHGVVA